MAYALQSGLHVSINGTTWYKLTDHNRREIDITPTLIEKEARMANGTLRKFVVAKKDIISVSWDFLPSKSSNEFTAVYSSQGGSGSSSVLVTNNSSILNGKIKSGQKITGTGFSSDTLVSSVVIGSSTSTIYFNKPATSQISGTITFTEYLLADADSSTYGGSWINSFYNSNVGIPISLKVIASKHTDPSTGAAPADNTYVSASTGEKIYQVFMTGFSKTIRKRNPVTDFLDITLEFTEI